MTPTAQVYTYFFIHIGVILVVCAYYALSAAIAPNFTYRARVRFARRPWLPALIGIGLSVPWVFAAIVLMQLPFGPVKFLGAVVGSLWILCGLVGGAGIAQQVGRGSFDPNLSDSSWIHSVRGGLFITLTWILPVIGWLGMLPLSLATGIGCLLLGFIPLRQPAAVAPASAIELPA